MKYKLWTAEGSRYLLCCVYIVLVVSTILMLFTYNNKTISSIDR